MYNPSFTIIHYIVIVYEDGFLLGMPIRWDSAWYSIKSEQIWSRESTAEEFNGNDVTTLSRSSSLVLFTLFQRFQQCTSIFRFAEINFTRKPCVYLKAGKRLIGRSAIFQLCLKSLMRPQKIFYQPNLFKEVAKVWINLLFQVPSLVTPCSYVTWYFLSQVPALLPLLSITSRVLFSRFDEEPFLF